MHVFCQYVCVQLYILCTVYVSGDIILHFCINVLVSKSSLYSNFNHEVPFARACISIDTICNIVSMVLVRTTSHNAC